MMTTLFALPAGLVGGVLFYPAWRLGPRAMSGPVPGVTAAVSVAGGATIVFVALLGMVLNSGQVPELIFVVAVGLGLWCLELPALYRTWLAQSIEDAREIVSMIPSADWRILDLCGLEARAWRQVLRDLPEAFRAEKDLVRACASVFEGERLYASLRILALGPDRPRESPQIGRTRAYWHGRVVGFRLLPKLEAEGADADGIRTPWTPPAGPYPGAFQDGVLDVLGRWGRTERVRKWEDSLPKGSSPFQNSR